MSEKNSLWSRLDSHRSCVNTAFNLEDRKWMIRLDREFKNLIIEVKQLECDHDWNADQDNDCNFCWKCGATQDIYTGQEES